MPGEHVCITHQDLRDVHGLYVAHGSQNEFEHACGIKFVSSVWRELTCVYRVVDARKLMTATLRYGWRVTPYAPT